MILFLRQTIFHLICEEKDNEEHHEAVGSEKVCTINIYYCINVSLSVSFV